MKIRLAYGREGLEVEVPEKNLAKILTMKLTPLLADPSGAVKDSLRQPIGCLPLGELVRGRKSVCIVVCDFTRPVPNKVLLPPMLDLLETSGVQNKNITILVATGLHRPSTPAELEMMLGSDILRRYAIFNHRASVLDEQRFVGRTRRNTPIYIDERYCSADLKITVGFIEPHLMAGFSGARKVVAIGCAGEETIKTLHSPAFLDELLCCEGSIDRNPLHHELLEIAHMAGHDFTIDVALDANKSITGVFAGHPQLAHAVGMEAVRKSVGATLPEPADIVLTTCAGFPLDLTYYQAIKGMTAALPVLKKGGVLILAAECAEGLGSERFVSMATRFRTSEEFDRWIHCHPVEVDQWQLQECAKAAQRGEVIVVSSGIRPEQQEKLFVQTAASVEEALQRAFQKFGPDASIAVIPKGPYTLVDVDSVPSSRHRQGFQN
jgi:nickel-dependent lactate racemase